jgi:hypothetical protein
MKEAQWRQQPKRKGNEKFQRIGPPRGPASVLRHLGRAIQLEEGKMKSSTRLQDLRRGRREGAMVHIKYLPSSAVALANLRCLEA